MQIRLAKGTHVTQHGFSFSDEQKLIRDSHVFGRSNRAHCCCKATDQLELVVAYLKLEDSFYFKKLPGQNPNSHSEDCVFRHTTNPGAGGADNAALTLVLPVPGVTPVTDHLGAKKLLKALWNELESVYINSTLTSYWKDISKHCSEIAQYLEVNHHPLADVFSLVQSSTVKEQVNLSFSLGRVVIGELYSANKANGNSIALKLKGLNNTIWISQYRVPDISQNSLNYLLCDNKSLPANERRLVLMTLINGNNNYFQANSIAVLKVNSKTFLKS